MGGSQGKIDPNAILNEAIETETENIKVLNNLLNLKLSILDKNSSLDSEKHPTQFNPTFILDKNINFDLVIKVLDKTSQIYNDNAQKQKLLDCLAAYVNDSLKDQYQRVRVLDFLVVFATKNKLESHLLKVVKPTFTYSFLLELMRVIRSSTEIKKLAFQTFISYFKLLDKPTKIVFINVVYKYCLEINNLDLICAFLNHIDGEYFNTESCCFSNDSFWTFIEYIISGHISHLQKQGIQILSNYVCTTTFKNIKRIFLSSDSEMAWQAFFLLIDVGREKQLHLVEPSLNLLKYINNLPFLWQKCCYKIFLEHSQLTIVYKVAIEIFQRVFNSQDELRQILNITLPAINKHEYSPLSCEVFESLTHFCDCLPREHFQVILEEITAISWNPVSFWKVIKSVLTNIEGKQKNVSNEVIQKILVSAHNLTHVYIRNECIKFIVASFWDESDQKQNFKIIAKVINVTNTDSIDYYFGPKVSLCKMFFDGNSNQLDEERWFSILQYSRTNNWTNFESNYENLSPHFKLLAWRDGLLQTAKSKTVESYLPNKIETFLLNYFEQNLYSNDTANVFIIVFKMLFPRRASMNEHTFTEVIRKPLFNLVSYNQSQIYVALVLVQQYLFTPFKNAPFRSYQPNLRTYFNIGMRGDLFICFSNIDDKSSISRIKVDNPLKGIECVNMIYKLASKRTFTEEVTKKTIEQFNVLLQSQGNQVVQNIYSKTHQIFSIIDLNQSPDVVKTLLTDFVTKNLYKNLLELKKDQYYKDIVSKFINIIVSENFIKYNNDGLDQIFDTLLNISLQYPQIRLTFIKELNGVVIRCNVFPYIMLVIDLYLQGIIVTKDERTEFNLCQEFINGYIFNDVNQIQAERVNPNAFDVAAKLWALRALVMIGETDAKTVISSLTSKYLENFKKRYFQDSKIHFEKLRLVQAMLIIAIQGNLSLAQKEELYSFALKCIEEESNQNCVTQILNLILIATLNHPATVISRIKALNSVPPTFIANLMPTLLHLTLLSNEESFESTIQLLLPWTMGAQFKTRVCAQYCVKQLLDHANIRQYRNLLSKFSYLEDCLKNCLTASEDSFANTLKTDILLLKDFDLLRDMLWSVILYDIPRLNKVHPTEWKNVKNALQELHKLWFKFQFPEKFSEFTDFSNAVDSYLKSNSKKTESEPIQTEISHIQKKIVPWKSALENGDDGSKSCDFILVASLIDKPQNLGGLSRTCEVFGISCIALNDAKIIADKEFKSLSMSSESWITPVEVKIKDLWDYIITLRKDGYRLVGAEQTSGSIKLNDFKFPKKMALILGNEKTGIPPELIPLLDHCVEIPQFGQTRSLNVHVAGATFIWEYAKQHLIHNL